MTAMCAKAGCGAPAGNRVLVLIDPDGERHPQPLLCGPDLDAVLPFLHATYDEGDPAYVVEERT